MENMFFNAENLNIPLNSWNVAKVTSMYRMFNCTDDVSGGQFNQYIGNWNVSIVQNMASMFRNQRFFNTPLSSNSYVNLVPVFVAEDGVVTSSGGSDPSFTFTHNSQVRDNNGIWNNGNQFLS